MNDELPNDLLCLKEAVKLIPSGRAGKKVHVSTLIRWVAAGKLRGYRRGQSWFVSRADLMALHRRQEPAPPSPAQSQAERRRAQEWAAATLREFGL